MASVGNYAKNHNRILKKYRRHSLWILWGVAFSVVCLTIFLPSTDFYMLKRYTQDTSIDTDGLMGFSFGGFINISSLPCVLFFTFCNDLNFVKNGFIIIATILNILMLAVCSVMTYYGYKGKLFAIIFGLVFYSFDFLLLPFFYLPSLNGLLWMDILNIFINVILHCASILFLTLAYFDRVSLINLKKEKDSLVNKEVVEKSDRKIITFIKKDDEN